MSNTRFFERFHTSFLILLSLVIPISMGNRILSPDKMYGTLILIVITVLLILVKTGRLHNVPLLDIIFLYSVGGGFTLASVNYPSPDFSVINYPPLETLHIFNYILLVTLLIVPWLVFLRKKSILIAVWVYLLITTSLLVTKPIDLSPGCSSYPVILSLYALTQLKVKNVTSAIGKLPVTIIVTGIIFISYFIIRYIQIYTYQSEVFLVSMQLSVTSLCFALLTFLLFQNQKKIIEQALYIYVVSTFGVILLTVLFRWMWLFKQYSFDGLIKFEMWFAFNHPNVIGIFIAASIPLIISNSNQSKPIKIFRILFLWIACILLVSTYSRNAWIGFALYFIGFIVIEKKVKNKKFLNNKGYKLKLIIIVLVFIGMIAFFCVGSYRLFSTDTIGHRITLWQICGKGIINNPVWGFGPGNHHCASNYIEKSTMEYYTFIDDWISWDRLGRHFHNIFLEVTWNFGILGCILMLGFCSVIIYEFITKKQYGSPLLDSVKWGLIILLFTSLFDFVFYYPAMKMLFFCFMGILLSFMSSKTRYPLPFQSLKLIELFTMLIIFILIIFMDFSLVVRPVIGENWFRRAENKKIDEVWWSLAAYQKAFFYLPWDAKITRNYLGLNDALKGGDGDNKIIQKHLRHSTCNPFYCSLNAWFQEEKGHALHMAENAVMMDPCGVHSGERYSDLALLQLKYDDVEGGINNYKKAFQLNPHSICTLSSFFARTKDGFIVRNETLPKYLKDRFGVTIKMKNSISDIFIPASEILDRIEAELNTMPSTAVNNERGKRNYIKMLTDFNRWERAVKLVDEWKINVRKHDDELPVRLKAYEAENPEYLVIRGKNELQKGHFSQAENLLETAIKKGYQRKEVYFELAKIKMHRKEWLKSLELLQKGHADNTQDPEILGYYAIIQFNLGNYDSASRFFKAALDLNPFSGKIHYYLALIDLKNDNLKKSLDHFAKAVEYLPSDPHIHLARIKSIELVYGRDSEEFIGAVERFKSKFDLSELSGEFCDDINDLEKKK